VAIVEGVIEQLAKSVPQDNDGLRSSLTKAGYFSLADLVEGNPRLVLDGATRQRSGAAGPDEIKATLTFQRGWISYRGAKSFADKKHLAFDKDAIDAYLKDRRRVQNALPIFSLSAEYTKIDTFNYGIPGVSDAFSEEGSHKLTGKASAGTYLGKDYSYRLELSASYDHASDDANLNNRFVAELSFVAQLNETLAEFAGGSDLVVSAIYANKPEFRGDVDRDLGVRAGLKWSFGKKKDDAEAK